jgi:hypothetical protein
LTQHRQIEHVVFAQLVRPLGELRFDFAQHMFARLQFDMVTLAVIKGQGFDALVLCQSVRQAGGGVLPARKQNQRVAVNRRLHLRFWTWASI